MKETQQRAGESFPQPLTDFIKIDNGQKAIKIGFPNLVFDTNLNYH